MLGDAARVTIIDTQRLIPDGWVKVGTLEGEGPGLGGETTARKADLLRAQDKLAAVALPAEIIRNPQDLQVHHPEDGAGDHPAQNLPVGVF